MESNWIPVADMLPEEPEEHEQQWKQSMMNTFLGGR